MRLPEPPRAVADGMATVRRAVLRHRRALAALCLAAAVLAGLQAVRPPPEPTTPVLVAARDLRGGTVLGPGDVREVRFAPGTAPEGSTPARDAVGRTLAAPLRRGEPVTDVRLVGPGLLAGYPGTVATPVPLPDPAAVSLLAVGVRVDVLGADPRSGEVRTLADDAPVVALPRPPADQVAADGTRLVVLAVPEEVAMRLAGAAVHDYLTLTISG